MTKLIGLLIAGLAVYIAFMCVIWFVRGADLHDDDF